jgi:hypothetical protein
MCYKKDVTRSGITPLWKIHMTAFMNAAGLPVRNTTLHMARANSGGSGGIKIQERVRSGKL